MTLKKMALLDYTCCPKCNGNAGVMVFQSAKVERHNKWGNPADYFVDDKIIVNKQKTNKTARCIECEWRFEIV